MNVRPGTCAFSVATSAAGMIAVPGCVSMRKVSHFPPAYIISAFANAAPPRVTFAPDTMMVPPFLTPASSSATNAIACFADAVCDPSRADARFCSVSPLARSTTAAGRSS